MDLCEGYILMKINQIEKLYHGTNQKFDAFDFNKAKNFKDFGKGYYLTTDFNQAQRWAQKRGDKVKKAYIYCYDVADVQTDSLKILELLQYDQKWLEFISKNRIEGRESDYDIIHDRIADNQYLEISNTLLDYKQSRISSEEAIERIILSTEIGKDILAGNITVLYEQQTENLAEIADELKEKGSYRNVVGQLTLKNIVYAGKMLCEYEEENRKNIAVVYKPISQNDVEKADRRKLLKERQKNILKIKLQNKINARRVENAYQFKK